MSCRSALNGIAAMIAGTNNFTVAFTTTVANGESISATATSLTTNDTSEFAQNVIAHTPGIVVTPSSGLITSEGGIAAQFTVKLNAAQTRM